MVAETSPMGIETFETMLEQHGPEIDNWPSPEQGRARDLLKVSSAAQSMLREEQALASLLSSRDAPRAPEGLAAKIVKKVRRSF